MKHIDFIKNTLDDPIQKHGILHVGNNLNDFFAFSTAEEYANTLSKHSNYRISKSSIDTYMGRIAENILVLYITDVF